jgi:hypothetical protein
VVDLLSSYRQKDLSLDTHHLYLLFSLLLVHFIHNCPEPDGGGCPPETTIFAALFAIDYV